MSPGLELSPEALELEGCCTTNPPAWLPSAQDFLDALHSHGYPSKGGAGGRAGSRKGKRASASGTSADAAAAPLLCTPNLKLMLHLLCHLCKLHSLGRLDLELAWGPATGGLLLALLHLQLDSRCVPRAVRHHV